MKRKLLCSWMGGTQQVLWIEDEIEDGVLSCCDITMRDYYLVHPDGMVTDDRGDGNWYGNVIDWNYEGEV